MKKHTRREFLGKTIVGAIGAGAVLSGLDAGALLAEQLTADHRSYAAARYGIMLDGIMAGWLHSAEGGHATSDPVAQKPGPAGMQRNPGAVVRYEDITLTCGMGMSRAFYEWIKATLEKSHMRKDGAIHSCDYDGNVKSTLDFFHGLITEVGFPTLDASSKDEARMTIKISPESTRMTKGSGKLSAGGPANAAQKRWLPANFRLQIPALDCSHVNRIEALTIKQKVIENRPGQPRTPELRIPTKEPPIVEVPNLVITLPEQHAAGLLAWQKESAGRSGHDAKNQKSGQLEYLSHDLREPLFTLNFHGLGIFKVTPDKTEARNENIRRVKAEMYCEEIRFSYGAGAWA